MKQGAPAGEPSRAGESSKAHTRQRGAPAGPRRGILGSEGPVVVNAAAAYLASMNPESSIDAVFAELVEEFDLLGDWDGRIEYVIEIGKELEPLPDADRTEANKVPGCAAQVWLAVRRDGDRLSFLADSDSALSKGNIALLLGLYSGRTAEQILAFDARAAMDRLAAHYRIG